MNCNKSFCNRLLLSVSFLLPVFIINAQSGRTITDLSKNNWQLWLDTAAQWQNDVLYPPPVDMQKLPVNLPTGGWKALNNSQSKLVHLPATVEEFYWGENGNKFGVSGNYLGVSWFTTKATVPAGFKSKKVLLHFESVRFRAEVFVNKKLVGYDLVNSTPFDIDITDAVLPGQQNEIAVRITDPNGNFDWRDSQNFMWGDYRTQPTHGFGGITGKVSLVATDAIFIQDIFVKNKSQPSSIDVQITSRNNTGKPVNGNYLLEIKDAGGKPVFSKNYSVMLAADNTTTNYSLDIPEANLWDVDHPNLYHAVVTWKGENGTSDSYQQRFGFRWFEVKNIADDQQFYLNGKRIVVRTSISWGFWPINGIAPSDSLARKQVADAKRLGLNMLNFHRTIGQQNVLDAADEMGLLYFEEPGGNQFPESGFAPKNALEQKQKDYYLAVRNEKFFRMIWRDRNHPSLVIYNMHNERGAQPNSYDKAEILAGHQLDPTRIITYNSSNGPIKQNEPDARFKLHLFPYDTTFYDYGWFDQHHAGGPGVYHDNLYNNPTNYAKYTDHKDEIIYYGEEGAIGTPPRLQLIRADILKRGTTIGWETDTYLKWYDAYDRFLREKGFSKAFPNVDSLTRKMGNVAYYYQGRVIENVRINNTIDGYAVNGWESMKLENHSGIVDNYRNLKGDPDLISYYNQPLYVAVKLNHKVVPVGDTVTADFFIVNEKDIKGACQLEVKAMDEKGKTFFQKSMPVNVTGGTTYGELLIKGIQLSIPATGYSKVSAVLTQNGKVVCTGKDEIFAVALNRDGINGLQVADTSGIMAAYFHSIGIDSFTNFTSGRPTGKTLLVGAFEPQQTGNPLVTEILEWVNNGNTLVVAGNIEAWAPYLGKKETIEFKGIQTLGTSWYGGNYFVKQHSLFAGLPQACVFNWEYQCLATYNKSRMGMRIENGETVVGCVSDHKQEVYSALSIVPHGRGKIILCSLDIMSCLKDNRQVKRAEGDGENASMNTFNASSQNPANVVGQQLLLNMLR